MAWSPCLLVGGVRFRHVSDLLLPVSSTAGDVQVLMVTGSKCTVAFEEYARPLIHEVPVRGVNGNPQHKVYQRFPHVCFSFALK